MVEEKQEDEGAEEAPDLNRIIFDAKVVITPFLQASGKAQKWAEEVVGIPPLKAWEEGTLDIEFDPDLSKMSNAEVGRLMNEAQEIKGHLGRVAAEMTNRVRDRQRALKTTKKVIKKALLKGGFKGTATALNDEVDVDPRVIKGEQVLTEAEDQLELVGSHYKAIEGKYKTLSRNVTLITDEHETFRRVDRVEGMRQGYQPGGPPRQGRRADRVSQQSIEGTDEG